MAVKTDLKAELKNFLGYGSYKGNNDAIKDMADRVVKLRDGMIRKNYTNEQKVPAMELEW